MKDYIDYDEWLMTKTSLGQLTGDDYQMHISISSWTLEDRKRFMQRLDRDDLHEDWRDK